MNETRPATDFVFDLAGVLVEWDPLPVYMDVFAGDRQKVQQFLGEIMGVAQQQISAGHCVETVLTDLAQSHPDYHKAIHAWRSRWQEMLRGEIEGSVAVLEELRERGYRTFALGNWSREEFEWARPRCPGFSGFDDVLLSGDCGVLKPDARIFRRAEQQFGLQPQHTVFIDDRAANAEAAVAAGWNALVFDDPRQLYLVLMEYGYL